MEEKQILPHHLELWQKTLNWTPSSSVLEKWQELYNQILSKNKYLNLTRITTVEEFWEKNLWDSLAPIIDYDFKNKKVIDIGTGGGFPGLPCAIAFPESEFILMDSIAKKVNFIDETKQILNIENVITLTNRAEIIGQDINHRNKYDFALIRAVAAISVCLEYTLPLLKQGGIAILYRGNIEQQEQEKIAKVAYKLGGELIEIVNKNTPINNYIRNNVYIKKITNTPKKYPREVGKPTKNPL